MVYFLSSDTLPQSYQNALLWCHRTNKIKSSTICQFQFRSILHINIVQNYPKGSKRNFLSDKTYYFILHTEKLTFISSIFNVHLFLLSKILTFRFCEAYLSLPSCCVLKCFYFSSQWTYLWFLTHHLLQVPYQHQIFPIWKCTYNSNFVFNFISILINT